MRVQVVRTSGFALLALAAVVLMVNKGPSVGDPDEARRELIDALGTEVTTDVAGLAAQALSDYEINDARAESAPQRQVTNGWVARDLLAAIALGQQQNINSGTDTQMLLAHIATDRAAADERPSWLLFLLVLGVALHLVTTPAPDRASANSTPLPPRQNEPEDLRPLD